MATHSSILAWRIPWTEEPGRLQPMGLNRVGHDWVTEHTHRSSQQCSLLIPACGFLTESWAALSCVIFVFAMGQAILLSLLLDASKSSSESMSECKDCCISQSSASSQAWRVQTQAGYTAFKLRCWRRILKVPWIARRSNQSILKEINPEYSLEGLVLKLKLQILLTTWCGELTHWKRLWYWERLKAKEGDGRGWDGWMPSPTQWTWVWANSKSWWRTGRCVVLQSMGSWRVGHDFMTEQQHRLNGWCDAELPWILGWWVGSRVQAG